MNFRTLYTLNLEFVNLGGKVKYLLRLPSLRKTLRLLSKNKQLIDQRRNDTIYICGLGPSLGDVDLDKISEKVDADSLVVNRFIKMSSDTKLQPTYYLLVDNAFATQPVRQVLDDAVAMYPNSNFIWNANFPGLSPDIMNIDCKRYFIAMHNGYYNKPKEIDITKVTPAFGNCICAAIAFAIGVGYKKIILLGCDFNSFAFPHEVHCYDGGRNNLGARQIALDFELFCYSFDATIHLKLAEYALKNGVEIINSTKGSLIDAYPVVIDENLYKHD